MLMKLGDGSIITLADSEVYIVQAFEKSMESGPEWITSVLSVIMSALVSGDEYKADLVNFLGIWSKAKMYEMTESEGFGQGTSLDFDQDTGLNSKPCIGNILQ